MSRRPRPDTDMTARGHHGCGTIIEIERRWRAGAPARHLRSHASLHAIISRLSDARAASDLRFSIFETESARKVDSTTVKRTIMFARLRAIAVLHSASPELVKRPSSLSSSNTVVQSMLRSCPTDCSLREFLLLALRIQRQQSLRSSNVPSDYSVLFPSAQNSCRLSICFEFYRDICEALQIDAHQSAVGVYREKRDFRDICGPFRSLAWIRKKITTEKSY